ncbi:MAG: hypothetical protein J0I43_00055 [Microbacterium sp.]|uniref:hypothetical protein n=1 Tax=Microbacterium sp. TaxID=51671 RepID=UPI001AD34CEF|nr:hypothetical protein [Microbacterium sp.]MBN9175752.1 hypothetical protein [Microbacterium sp.]
MNNAIQWFYLGVGVLAIVLPLIVVGFLRPWRRIGADWRWALWGLAAAIGVLVGSLMLVSILGSSGDLSNSRAQLLDAGLAAMGPVPGAVLFALIVIVTVLASNWLARGRRVPDVLDATTTRILARRGVNIDELRAAYVPTAEFSEDLFDASISLGQADREAGILRARVLAYSPRGRRSRDLRRAASALESRVRAATTPNAMKATLAELRTIARHVEGGELPQQ